MKHKWISIENIDIIPDKLVLKESEKFLEEIKKEDKRLINEFVHNDVNIDFKKQTNIRIGNEFTSI
jgi:hypothetical protein